MAVFTATVFFPGKEFAGYDSECSTGKVIGFSVAEVFLAGKKTVAVKTAMKRLGNRSDKKVKNLC